MAEVNDDLISSIQLRALQASENEIFSGIGRPDRQPHDDLGATVLGRTDNN